MRTPNHWLQFRRTTVSFFIFTCALSIAHSQSVSVTATGVTVTRGGSANLTCTPDGGCPPYTYSWTNWTKGNSSAEKTTQNPSVKVLETCDVTVTVTDSTSPTPQTATATVTITVNERGWSTQHNTSEDVWTDWGSFPFGIMGLNTNANTHSAEPIIGSVQDNDWSGYMTRVQVQDSNGPFDQYWYHSTHNLRVERETRINQYLKGQVAGACFNWVTVQNNYAATTSDTPTLNAAAVRAGVMAHENNGGVANDITSVPPKGGHSGLFKAKQAQQEGGDYPYNAAKAIEPIYHASSEDALKNNANTAIQWANDGMAIYARDPLKGNLKSYIVYNYDCSTSTPATMPIDQ